MLPVEPGLLRNMQDSSLGGGCCSQTLAYRTNCAASIPALCGSGPEILSRPGGVIRRGRGRYWRRYRRYERRGGRCTGRRPWRSTAHGRPGHRLRRRHRDGRRNWWRPGLRLRHPCGSPGGRVRAETWEVPRLSGCWRYAGSPPVRRRSGLLRWGRGHLLRHVGKRGHHRRRRRHAHTPGRPKRRGLDKAARHPTPPSRCKRIAYRMRSPHSCHSKAGGPKESQPDSAGMDATRAN